jgi:hypothetical protein
MIRDITLPVGVSRGASPSDRAGRWYDSNNIRSKDGRIMPIGGHAQTTATPLPSKVRKIFAMQDNQDIKRIVYGLEDRILVEEGTVRTDISPPDLIPLSDNSAGNGYGAGLYGAEAYGTPRSTSTSAFARAGALSMSSWGQDLLVVSSTDGRLLHWSATTPTTALAVVPNAPTGSRAMVVTDQRYVILIGPGDERRRVAWSDQENFFFWDYLDETNTAGFLDLDTAGVLTAAVKVNDGILVWSDDGTVWLVYWEGGDLIHGAKRVGTGVGLMNPNTIATVDGRAYWLDKTGGVWLYEGGACQPVPCEVSDVFASEMNMKWAALHAHASFNGYHREIWFWLPTATSQECDRYVILDLTSGAWWLGRMSRTAMLASGVNRYPLMAGADDHIYQHEFGWFASGLPRTGEVWVESSVVSADGQVAVLRAQTDSGAGANRTQLEFICSQTRDGPETTYGPYTARPDGWTPTRAGGRHVRIRITEVGDGGDWSIGRMLMDTQPVGNR